MIASSAPIYPVAHLETAPPSVHVSQKDGGELNPTVEYHSRYTCDFAPHSFECVVPPKGVAHETVFVVLPIFVAASNLVSGRPRILFSYQSFCGTARLSQFRFGLGLSYPRTILPSSSASIGGLINCSNSCSVNPLKCVGHAVWSIQAFARSRFGSTVISLPRCASSTASFRRRSVSLPR